MRRHHFAALALVLWAAAARAAPAAQEEAEESRPSKPWTPPRLKPTASRYDSFGAVSATTTARVSFQQKTKVPTAAEIGAQVKDEVKVPLTPFEWPDKAGAAKVEAVKPAAPPKPKAPVKEPAPEGPKMLRLPAVVVAHELRWPCPTLNRALPARVPGAPGPVKEPGPPYCPAGCGMAPGVAPKKCCKDHWHYIPSSDKCTEFVDGCPGQGLGPDCLVVIPDPDSAGE